MSEKEDDRIFDYKNVEEKDGFPMEEKIKKNSQPNEARQSP